MKTEDIKNIARAWQQVQEKLTGNQHKIDHNKNGKIDAGDFEHMRSKKKKVGEDEEVEINPKMKTKKKANAEMTAEAKLDELSPALLKRYTKKADKDAVKSFNKATDHEDDDDSTKHDKLFDRGMKRADGATKAREKLVAKGHKAPKYPNEGVMDKVHDIRRKVFGKSDAEKRAEAERNAMAGFHKAMNKAADHAPSAMGAAIKKKKNESVEQVDEISMDKATRTYAARKSQAQAAAHQGSMDYAKKQMAKARKTKAYMDKRESVEQVDEISKDKVGRYIKKAMVSTSDAGMDTASQDKDIRKRGINTFVKRRMGASDAVRKLTGKARVPATESTTPTVYSRILEERAKHYKGATKPEDWDEKEKNNKGAMDMKKDMAVDTSDKISNYDDLGHDDASKAGRVTKAAKGRPGDNAAGDKNVINPVKK